MRKRAKQTEPKRGIVTTLRLTADERVQIDRKANEAGMLLSDYMRQQSLRGQIVRYEMQQMQLPFEVLLEMKRIGVNLNQIARAMNSGFGPPPELVSVCSRLERIIMRHIEQELNSRHS